MRRILQQREKKEELLSETDRLSVSPFVQTPKATDVPNTHLSLNLHTQSAEDAIIKMNSELTNPLQCWLNIEQTFGNQTFILWMCLLFLILDVVAISACLIFLSDILISYAVQTFVYILLLVFIQFHVYQLSPFRDEFFVRNQFVTELKIIYLNCLLWVITLCIWYFFRDDDDNFNIYNYADMNVRIVVRFLLNINMTFTSFLLIFAEFAIPLFKYEQDKQISHRNVFRGKANGILKMSLTDTIAHRGGYYLFMEYLMGRFSVENLLFITEVAFMKQKFSETVVIAQIKSPSVAESLKLAFSNLSERKRSENSVSKSNQSNDSKSPMPLQVPSKAMGASSPSSDRISSFDRLRKIPSDDAIVQTQSDLDILNKAPTELLDEQERYTTLQDHPSDISESAQSNEMEMGTINGKSLSISRDAFGIRMNEQMNDTQQQHRLNIINHVKDKSMQMPNLPHTVTLAESMKQDNLFDAVDMIYDNFIKLGSGYEINISSGARKKIIDIVTKHRLSLEQQREKMGAVEDLEEEYGGVVPNGLSGIIVDVHIFDEAGREVMKLLDDLFWGFAATKPYQTYCKAMGK